ncbi:nuclear pore complex protein NUP50B-like [Primulina tabacum]|uniref:nuclear pore complex protein NUP50B-like n=1 Tax=Primulina tabacum TaxID=48773 RepID=UPI003F59102E
MGDAENNFQHTKKRTAGVQLSRENPGIDDYEGTCENEEGTFKRASDEVLATRRIVKVRRHQTSSTSSAPDPTPVLASNPFATIRLVPPASFAPQVEVEECNVPSEKAEEVKTDSNNAIEPDEPKVETNLDKCNITSEKAEEDVKTDNSNASESDGLKVESNLEEEKTGVNVANNFQQSEVAKSENSGEGAKNTAENHNTENKVNKDTEGEINNEEKANVEGIVEKNSDAASFSSFQKLSNGQNAFSGFAGRGFASSTFSFGSTPTDGSLLGSTTGSLFGLKNDHSSFGFGVSDNGNSSLFGTFGCNTFYKSESSKSSSMPEVPVETGEENEKTVFMAYAVLFEYVGGAWKERGKGDLKVNVPTTGTGKSRLVMRSQGNYRLILNANLFPDLKLTNMEKKGITFTCVNSAGEGKDGLSTIALKFKDASSVENFHTAVTFHKDSTSVSPKTPENSP